MGLPKAMPRLTEDEYLAIERSSLDRHTYLDGEMHAMAGESGEHGDITVNVVASLASQLKGGPCRARTKDTKVRSGPGLTSGPTTAGMYSYPDIVVICDDPEYRDHYKDVILNPKVITEVLSPSTENFDRGEKFHRYQTWNPTLTDYILIAQDRPQIEHYGRRADGSWSYKRTDGLEASVEIASIQCRLMLADVYDRVRF